MPGRANGLGPKSPDRGGTAEWLLSRRGAATPAHIRTVADRTDLHDGVQLDTRTA